MIPPQLNMTCTISNRTISDEGDVSITTVASGVKCRYALANRKVNSSTGEYVNFTGYLHMGTDVTLYKGMVITVDEGNYEIEEVARTNNLNGDVFMQYVIMQLIYVS